MAEGTEDEWKEYPLWGRIVMAVGFLGGDIGLGYAVNGVSGMVVGGVLGAGVALLALFMPPVLAYGAF